MGTGGSAGSDSSAGRFVAIAEAKVESTVNWDVGTGDRAGVMEGKRHEQEWLQGYFPLAVRVVSVCTVQVSLPLLRK